MKESQSDGILPQVGEYAQNCPRCRAVLTRKLYDRRHGQCLVCGQLFKNKKKETSVKSGE